MTRDDIAQFMALAFPDHGMTITAVDQHGATLRCAITEAQHLRPGNTVSGPAQMALADAAMYVAIQGALGFTPQAVTTSLTINFLRRPKADRALIAQCALLKVGSTLVTGEVSLFSEGEIAPVAHVVATYALPRASGT